MPEKKIEFETHIFPEGDNRAYNLMPPYQERQFPNTMFRPVDSRHIPTSEYFLGYGYHGEDCSAGSYTLWLLERVSGQEKDQLEALLKEIEWYENTAVMFISKETANSIRGLQA